MIGRDFLIVFCFFNVGVAKLDGAGLDDRWIEDAHPRGDAQVQKMFD